MNTSRILEEEIANAVVPPRGDQVPHLEEDGNDDQVSVNPPPLTDDEIRAVIFQMSQAYYYPSTSRHYSIRIYDGPSKPRGCAPSSSTSGYYGFPSKGLHLNKPSYFLWEYC